MAHINSTDPDTRKAPPAPVPPLICPACGGANAPDAAPNTGREPR